MLTILSTVHTYSPEKKTMKAVQAYCYVLPLDFLFPNGFWWGKCAYYAPNAIEDKWNEKIWMKNFATTLACTHYLFFWEWTGVDDSNRYLASMIAEDIVNKFNNADIPPHEFIL